MDAVLERIADADLITSHFGEWPAFHDSEVLSIELTRDGEPRLTMRLNAFSCVVTFRFFDVAGVELAYFNHQNVLFSLTFTSNGEQLRVDLAGVFGLSGKFTCSRAEVVSLEPLEGTGAAR